jgi:acetyl esterase/lipase
LVANDQASGRQEVFEHLQQIARRVAALPAGDIEALRSTVEGLPLRAEVLPGTRVEPALNESVRGYWVIPDHVVAGRRVLFCHGLSLIAGSIGIYRRFLGRVAEALHAEVYFADYRLVPGHRYPAAHDDCAAALDWLWEHGANGQQPARELHLVADSVGASLALWSAQREVKAGRCVHSLEMFSPFLDLAVSGATAVALEGRDPLVSVGAARAVASLYAPDHAPNDPALSPLFGQLSGLPPLRVFGTSDDLFLDDVLRLAARAASAGTSCETHLWAGLPHAWYLFGEHFNAVDEAMRMLRARVNG